MVVAGSTIAIPSRSRVLRRIASLAVLLAVCSSAHAECTKDEIVKMIDKGFDKPTIDRLCASTAQTSPKSAVLALLALVEAAHPRLADYDAPAREFGLQLSYDHGDRRAYTGFSPSIGMRVDLQLSHEARVVGRSETVAPRDSSGRPRYNTLLAAAQEQAAKTGLRLESRYDTFRPIPECTWSPYGYEKYEAGNGERLARGRGLVLVYSLGGQSQCRETDGRNVISERQGQLHLGYHVKAR